MTAEDEEVEPEDVRGTGRIETALTTEETSGVLGAPKPDIAKERLTSPKVPAPNHASLNGHDDEYAIYLDLPPISYFYYLRE